jgi:hypothetical protein
VCSAPDDTRTIVVPSACWVVLKLAPAGNLTYSARAGFCIRPQLGLDCCLGKEVFYGRFPRSARLGLQGSLLCVLPTCRLGRLRRHLCPPSAPESRAQPASRLFLAWTMHRPNPK